MNIDLTDKVVLVTGAGSGLGEATARAFAGAGAAVGVVDLRREAAEKVAAELEAAQTDCLPLACDVGDAEQVTRCVDTARQRWGRIDVVVNCAAVDHTLSIEDMTIAQWDQVVAVNLRGPFLLAKAVLPGMRQQRYGHIVNIASTAATRAWANASAYHATKWGLVGFGRALGVEGRPDNIRVTTVIPGGMRTHFFDRFEAQGIPMPDPEKLQDPANVAESILFAVRMPPQSALQELIITPIDEPSWP